MSRPASDRRLNALLARAAMGDVDAFMEFYDATCDQSWKLEMRRHGDARTATEATYARYAMASRQAANHPRTGLSARAWLLSDQLRGLRSQRAAPGDAMRAS